MPPDASYERDKLSVLLRGLRVGAGLTVTEAARRAGFSKAKLSKAENGSLLPSFADGQSLCRVYEVSERQRDEVLDLLRALHKEVESARVILARGAYRKQQQIAKIEAASEHYRDLQVAMVSGLLQTAAYIERMAARAMGDADRGRYVAARLARQQILLDASRQFTFVMTEGALRWRAGPALMMAAQVDHVAEVSQLPNVAIGVVPWDTEAPAGVMPGHEVHIYDDQLVIVGIQTATANIQDPRDIAMYLALFRQVEQIAVFGDQARWALAQIAGDYRSLAG